MKEGSETRSLADDSETEDLIDSDGNPPCRSGCLYPGTPCSVPPPVTAPLDIPSGELRTDAVRRRRGNLNADFASSSDHPWTDAVRGGHD
eukprot:6897279-Lingulodinium_polyedra.AAC.1